MISWIKVRSELPTCQKILRLQSMLGCSQCEAIGIAVLWFTWVDMNCEDDVTHLARHEFELLFNQRHADGVTNVTHLGGQRHADGVTNVTHLGGQYLVFNAMRKLGWVDLDENDEVIIVDFEKHNGKCAKKRAQNTNRKQAQRCHADGVTQLENNVTHPARPDKIIEDKNNNISLKGTSNQCGCVNNNTSVFLKEQEANSQKGLETAFTPQEVQMSCTEKEMQNRANSVTNNGNFNKPRTNAPCTIVEVMSFMTTYFPDFSEEQKASIAHDFFVQNSRKGWISVTNWKLSLQRYIQSITISA